MSEKLKIQKNIESNIGEVWGSEVNLYYPDLYAGTTDLVGIWKGEPAIMDFKQTNKPKKREWVEDYFLQLCAYSEAHDALFDTNIQQGIVFMCSRDGEFQQFEIAGDEFSYYKEKWADRITKYYNIDKDN
jgi:genome maintenance exonuclease 1